MKVLRALCIVMLATLAVSILASSQETFTAGTWTATNNAPPSPVAHALLLTDGSVLVNSYFFHSHVDSWYRLVPDSTGSYINGTWVAAGNLPSGYNPLYFASAVASTGQVVVMGGEYNNGVGVWTTLGAYYTPATHTWARLPSPPGWTTVGDAQSVILPNGTFMLANCCSTQESILSISAGKPVWTATGTGKFDENDEEGWTLLPGGKILTVDAYVGSDCCHLGYQIYNPATGAWTTPSNNTVVNLVDPGSFELGPMVLLPNGTVFAAGATTNNAIYTVATGTWAAAPSFGSGLDIADGPAAVLPNGNALFDTSQGVFNLSTHFFEWDGSALHTVPNPPNAVNVSSYQGNMVVLPTGQIFFTDFTFNVAIYTPAGSPCTGCAPKITSVATTLTHGSINNKLQGTQLTGLDQGAYYGDDNQSSTNFPLVRITDSSGKIVYCRTHGFPGGIAAGAVKQNTQFDIPSTIAQGSASLVVVTNGIPSAAVAVTIN